MSLVVRKPADDPQDWLLNCGHAFNARQQWKIYHWQEDNLKPDWRDFHDHGFKVDTVGNGHCYVDGIQFQPASHRAEGAFQVFNIPSSIASSLPFSIACAMNINKVTDIEFMAGLFTFPSVPSTVVSSLSNAVTFYGCASFSSDNPPGSGFSSAGALGADPGVTPAGPTGGPPTDMSLTSFLGLLDFYAVNPTLNVGAVPAVSLAGLAFDGCNSTLYLRMDLTQDSSKFYYSTDGVSWVPWLQSSPHSIHDSVGFGYFAGSGVVASGANEAGVSFDWVAHTITDI